MALKFTSHAKQRVRSRLKLNHIPKIELTDLVYKMESRHRIYTHHKMRIYTCPKLNCDVVLSPADRVVSVLNKGMLEQTALSRKLRQKFNKFLKVTHLNFIVPKDFVYHLSRKLAGIGE